MRRVLVSACLLGEHVRYDGRRLPVDRAKLTRWMDEGRVVPFCPEVASGLPVPRTPAEIVGGDGHAVLAGTATVVDAEGNDVSAQFVDGAKRALLACEQHDIRLAVLTELSPSCGSRRIYDGSFSRTRIPGSGVTAALLETRGIRVLNERELPEAEAYLARNEK